ncbi:MAG: hypothetical protein RLZZ371_17 [Pseudomonadota bacterium]
MPVPSPSQMHERLKPSTPLLLGFTLAAAGAIAFSTKAIIVKLAYRHGVDAITLIMLRMVIALPIFLIMAWWAGRGKASLTRRDWQGVVAIGVSGYYLSSVFDFLGLQYITSSLERLILYLVPTIVMLLGIVLHRKPWNMRQVLGMVVSYCGVLMVLGQEVHLVGGNVPLGALLVFGSSVTYAMYFVFSDKLVQRLGSLRLAGLATSVACLCCIAQFLIVRPMDVALSVVPQVLWLSLLNALLAFAMPVLLVMMAIERIGPALTAQIGMVGPLSTILMAVWLLDEPFTAWIAVGTALVITGIFVLTKART